MSDKQIIIMWSLFILLATLTGYLLDSVYITISICFIYLLVILITQYKDL